MKKNIGIWIDTKQALVVNISKNEPSIKKIESNIVLRERVPGESKKFGRFNGQYLTYEKNRMHRKTEQTNQFLKELLKEVQHCDSVVLLGPANMKKMFEKEINNTMQISSKLVGVYNSELLTDNQLVAWVKDFYKK